jgi:ketosteroid isomerase-like protein
MKMISNLYFSCFSILFFSILAFPQKTEVILEKTVKPHQQIDEIYSAFSKGYKELNIDLVANLYTEDANYLASGEKMTDGREKIRENFARFFDSVKNNGSTINIQFRILQREVDKKLGYEVGIYTLTTFKDGKQIGTAEGKFFVVTKKIGKKWFFRFDSYSGLETEKK